MAAFSTFGAIMLGSSLASSAASSYMQSRAQGKAAESQARSDAAALAEAREEKAFDRMVYADERQDTAQRRGVQQYASQRAARMMVPGGWKKGSKVIAPARETPSDRYAREYAENWQRQNAPGTGQSQAGYQAPSPSGSEGTEYDAPEVGGFRPDFRTVTASRQQPQVRSAASMMQRPQIIRPAVPQNPYAPTNFYGQQPIPPGGYPSV